MDTSTVCTCTHAHFWHSCRLSFFPSLIRWILPLHSHTHIHAPHTHLCTHPRVHTHAPMYTTMHPPTGAHMQENAYINMHKQTLDSHPYPIGGKFLWLIALEHVISTFTSKVIYTNNWILFFALEAFYVMLATDISFSCRREDWQEVDWL